METQMQKTPDGQVGFGFKPTYKEWKLFCWGCGKDDGRCFKPTYKEWKLPQEGRKGLFQQ